MIKGANMTAFQVGKKYYCNDCGVSPIRIIKRTAKMCLVENDIGVKWRMMIRQQSDTEIMIDTKVPEKWRGIYTYDARFEI